MTTKIFKFLSLLALCVTIIFIASAPATFAPENQGGNATTNCGGCHSGNSNPNATFTISGIPATYLPGQSYGGQICLTDDTQTGPSPGGGFSMWQTDFATNTFAAGDATSATASIGRYLVQTSRKNFDASGTACWSFTWNAPMVGGGTKTISAAGNAVNGDNGNGSLDRGKYSTSVMTNEGVLPVDLIDFTLAEKAEFVDIKWETAEEINNDYFEIQRSYDIVQWETLIKIEGAGNSNEYNHYQFTDEKVQFNRPIYYRLKQIDFDGSFEYSLVKKILIDRPFAQFDKVYPNPVFRSESLKVSFDLKESISEIDLIIYDIMGHQKLVKQFDVVPGLNVLEVAANDLPAGHYYVSVVSDYQRIQSEAFIVSQ